MEFYICLSTWVRALWVSKYIGILSGKWKKNQVHSAIKQYSLKQKTDFLFSWWRVPTFPHNVRPSPTPQFCPSSTCNKLCSGKWWASDSKLSRDHQDYNSNEILQFFESLEKHRFRAPTWISKQVRNRFWRKTSRVNCRYQIYRPLSGSISPKTKSSIILFSWLLMCLVVGKAKSVFLREVALVRG